MRQTSKRISIIALHYTPILLCVFMTAHVGCLAMSGTGLTDPAVMSAFFGYSTISTVQLLVCSHALGYCWSHRRLILYNELVADCIGLQQRGVFDKCLLEARTAVFITGLIVLLVATLKCVRDGYTKDSGG